ncbi:hypothetical protein FUT88_13595 [Ralstonia sp. TCR112]|uniref:hypothetical protein n=1 Tax=Ralstonia sp. TCR112 TaxID=2601730 RepID=UPI0011BE07B8|nr:hypothetical protein [Ralstonia sp. TCR112]TXD58901.1 hypothetical protein FUT88_13595 [Ralstonia sp. TCR112]
MARASDDDLKAALDVSRILVEELAKGYMPSEPDAEDDGIKWFDRDDPDQCKVALNKLLDAADKGSLFRVIFGMTVLLDPRNKLTDPDADTLEAHPEIVASEDDAARYRWWVDPAHDIPSSVLYSGKAVVDAYIDGEIAAAKKREAA